MTLAFYVRYGLRSLARGGQRTLLALLCVAFGVMSLVAMQLLAGLIAASVVGDPRSMVGGDAAVQQERGAALTAAQLDTLARLQADGTLRAVTLVAPVDTIALRPGGTGEVYFLTHTAHGVDPASYPLVGSIPLRAPAGQTFAAAIAPPLSAVVTRDLADTLNLHPGDHFRLIGGDVSASPELTVGGVAEDVPDRRGDTVLFSLDTARRLAGRPQVVTGANILWGARGPAPAPLQAAGLGLYTADDYAANPGNAGSVFDFMLKAAGILGLVVGGIGVANTLQVMLARRTLEIAALKTLGYRRRDLLALFGVETALLGLVGGVAGMLVGLGLARILIALLDRSGLFLLPWAVDGRILAGGVLAGVLTAVIFGLYTIVRASEVRPAVLLREAPARQGWGGRLAGGALLLVLLALFGAISAVVMGSPLAGAQVIGGALAGLIALTLLFGALIFLLLRLPLPRRPLLVLARRNLSRRPLRAVFPLIALFMGLFAIGFATGTVLDALARVTANQQAAQGYNLAIYGRAADRTAISAAVAAQGVNDAHAQLIVPATVQTGAGAPLPGLAYLDGRALGDATWEAQVITGAWSTAADAALVPVSLATAAGLRLGDPLQVTVDGAPSTTLHIAGFYIPQPVDSRIRPPKQAAGLLLSEATALRLGGPDTAFTVVSTVPSARLAAVTAALGAALPQSSVASSGDLLAAVNRRFQNLLDFVVGVAGLALVAGLILIANGVGLAVIERRRELGILKAVGFSAGRVLGLLALENGLLGLLAGALATAAVAGAMAAINLLRPAAQLSLDPGLAGTLVAVAVLLTVATSALVAWQPTHVRPLDVLRAE